VSVRDAVEDYTRRNSGRGSKRKKNDSPEEPVVKDHVDWYKDQGMFIRRYESKAKLIKGVWRASGVEVGTPDLGGTGHFGFSHWNEIKAPGRRVFSAMQPGQLEFLERVIDLGGFGCVSDSVEYTKKLYSNWLDNRSQLYLKLALPAKRNLEKGVSPIKPPF